MADFLITAFSEKSFVYSFPFGDFNIGEKDGKGIDLKNYFLKEDLVKDLFVSSSNDDLLIFTNIGRIYKVKSSDIFDQYRDNPGKKAQHIRDLLKIDISVFSENEKVIKIIPFNSNQYSKTPHLFLTTKQGIVKKMELSAFSNSSKNGSKVIELKDGDELGFAVLLGGEGKDEILITSSAGNAIRFKSSEITALKQGAQGIKGINLKNPGGKTDFEVISVSSTLDGKKFFTLTSKNKSKYVDVSLFRITGRGVKGVSAYKFVEKFGKLISGFIIDIFNPQEVLFVFTNLGKVRRIRADGISSRKSRLAEGVSIMTLNKNKGEEIIHCFKFLNSTT